MAVDSRVLLQGLIEYRRSLQQHIQQMRNEFASLENRWRTFSAVYEGDAADQFRANWLRTASRFDEYISHTTQIERVLEARIESLQEVNRTESIL